MTSLAKANEVRWYGHVLRTAADGLANGHALKEALHLKIEGIRKAVTKNDFVE